CPGVGRFTTGGTPLMARVVCQVLAHPRRLTFRWSAAGNSFEPFHLENAELHQFHQAAERARLRLPDLARAGGQDAATVELARAGHELYRHLLPATGPAVAGAGEVRDWLHSLTAVESLEIVGDAPGLAPWAVVCDREPQANAEPCRSCWGVRYNLTVTHRY